MAARHDTGDGDKCPLFPEHGNMHVIPSAGPPMQRCIHVAHDGRPEGKGAPPSRASWPLHGFEDSVKTYMARLDRAIRQAELPDLSDLSLR